MCVLFLAYKQHPNYPLIIAANRDEFYDRPTEQAHFWKDEPNILAGRDLKELGTWLGITRTGQFAAITNHRDPLDIKRDNQISRGQIIRNYLSTIPGSQSFLQNLQQKREQYQGFNLLLGNLDSLWYYSNVQNERIKLKPGIYGLSNHHLNTPWPKVRKGKHLLEKYIDAAEKMNKEWLFNILENDDAALQDELPNTGIDVDWEMKLSPIFIKTNHYGTRSSTVLTVDRQLNVDFTERSFINQEKSEVHFQYSLT